MSPEIAAALARLNGAWARRGDLHGAAILANIAADRAREVSVVASEAHSKAVDEVYEARNALTRLLDPEAEAASDICAACGHDRVFHRVGTGNGVPVGKAFCDDRHAEKCGCVGFARSGT